MAQNEVDKLIDIKKALDAYATEIKTRFSELATREQKGGGKANIASILQDLRSLVIEMQKLDKATSINRADFADFFNKFSQVTKTMDSLPELVSEAVVKATEARKSAVAKVGDGFESDAIKHLNSIQELSEKLFNITEKMMLSNETLLSSIDARLMSIEQQAREKKEEEDKDNKDEKEKQKTWRQLILEKLGLGKGTKANGLFSSLFGLIASPFKWLLAFLQGNISPQIKTLFSLLGAPFKLLRAGGSALFGGARKLGIANLGRLAGIAGGAYGLYSGFTSSALNRGPNGVQRGFFEDDEQGHSRAGAYASAALGGASLGASIGSFAGPVGTLVGGAIGGVGGAAATLIKDYLPEIKGYLDKSGIGKNISDTWKSVVSTVGGIGDWIGTVADDIENSEFVKKLSSMMGKVATAEATMFTRFVDWIGSGISRFFNNPIVKTLQGGAKQIWGFFFDSLGRMFDMVGDVADLFTTGDIGKFLTTEWDRTKDSVEKAFGGISSFFGWVGNNLERNIVSPLLAVVSAVSNSIADMIDHVVNSAVGKFLPDSVKNLSATLRNTSISASNGAAVASQAGLTPASTTASTKSALVSASTAPVASAGTITSTPSPANPKSNTLDPTIGQIITQAAQSVGVDPALLMSIAARESGFNPNAKAKTSSATGLFQFTNSTWRQMVSMYGASTGIKIGDINDPKANAVMGALFTRDNIAALSKAGIAITPQSVYTAHFMGVGGATSLINAANNTPNADASALFGQAASSNPSIFLSKNGKHKTVAEVYASLGGLVSATSSSGKLAASMLASSTPATALASAANTMSESNRVMPSSMAVATAAQPVNTPSRQAISALPLIPTQMDLNNIPATISDEGLVLLNFGQFA